MKESVEAWGAENNVEVTYQAPTEIDAAAQVQIMTDLVNQGEIDALLFSPNDPAPAKQSVRRQERRGIIVIATEASVWKTLTMILKLLTKPVSVLF